MENRHTCKNRGWAVRMQKSIVRKWIPNDPEVIRWTCPACGWTGVQVDTHGKAITTALMTRLLAL